MVPLLVVGVMRRRAVIASDRRLRMVCGVSVIGGDSEINKNQVSARFIGVISRSDPQAPRFGSIVEWQWMRVLTKLPR